MADGNMIDVGSESGSHDDLLLRLSSAKRPFGIEKNQEGLDFIREFREGITARGQLTGNIAAMMDRLNQKGGVLAGGELEAFSAVALLVTGRITQEEFEARAGLSKDKDIKGKMEEAGERKTQKLWSDVEKVWGKDLTDKVRNNEKLTEEEEIEAIEKSLGRKLTPQELEQMKALRQKVGRNWDNLDTAYKIQMLEQAAVGGIDSIPEARIEAARNGDNETIAAQVIEESTNNPGRPQTTADNAANARARRTHRDRTQDATRPTTRGQGQGHTQSTQGQAPREPSTTQMPTNAPIETSGQEQPSVVDNERAELRSGNQNMATALVTPDIPTPPAVALETSVEGNQPRLAADSSFEPDHRIAVAQGPETEDNEARAAATQLKPTDKPEPELVAAAPVQGMIRGRVR